MRNLRNDRPTGEPPGTPPLPSAASPPLRILALQPFAGDSHRALLEGWRSRSRHAWTVLELPPVHWKWRMRHGPLTLAERARRLVADGSCFDAVFCTDMLPLHEWRGLVGPPLANLPAVLYFHENQLTYPTDSRQTPDLHYGYTNLLSMLAAEEVWFNSEYHRSTFRTAAAKMLARMPDQRHAALFQSAFDAAVICPPGIELPPRDASSRGSCADDRPLRIGWVSRWEHDKRPERFAEAIDRLPAEDCDFRLVLLGQRFRNTPPALHQIAERHVSRILFNGYAPSRREYWRWLSEIDIVVSTAEHEFFGIAIAEAVAQGALPLVPDRLAYPELLGRGGHPALQDCFYDGSSNDLASRLAQRLREGVSCRASLQRYLGARMQNFAWPRLASEYDERIAAMALRTPRSTL